MGDGRSWQDVVLFVANGVSQGEVGQAIARVGRMLVRWVDCICLRSLNRGRTIPAVAIFVRLTHESLTIPLEAD